MKHNPERDALRRTSSASVPGDHVGQLLGPEPHGAAGPALQRARAHPRYPTHCAHHRRKRARVSERARGEGVENHQMAALLNEMNCDLVQGYHYCAPIPADDFLQIIRSRQCYI